MSFCRITGKARGLPKPNYFPLLPPISPADAKRFCRITNKSQGLPGHHFVPVLFGARSTRAHCRVTGKSEGQAPHHFPSVDNALKAHDFIPGYKYVFPKFDEDKKLQQKIIQLMASKAMSGESNARYVYAIEESLTGLVIPAGLEAAVRDGDIRDLFLDKEKDTMLVKLYHGPSVTVGVTDLVMEDGVTLWDGLGPSQAIIKKWEKEDKEMELRKKKRQEGLHKRKQIFEDKERAADEEEMEMTKIKDARKSKIVKVTMRGGTGDADVSVENGTTPLESYLMEINEKPVFGHIVQTATAVEFFPGETILNLPEGKVVPGRLVRNAEGVKFVPGIMSDGRFIPGQVVMTNAGEQFVPGQVVDTQDGPKFVPGQVAETESGPKFVPGQTIQTEDGPQFVPGQIIETKAGPTFIPGQIIVTDDKPRFVPGRVVETSEGPRFVPGRVIESGNQVTFVSGQVVETSEGLKFVAPDLEYMPEGGHEFSVQGFEVSPEELKLLRPVASCGAASSGAFTIDSKMLKQLAEAGMSVGRQVPTKLPEVLIRELPVVVEKLKLNGAEALKMSHVMTVLSQVALKISQRSDLCASDIPLEADIGDKILCAVKNRKDLGKYLKAIVASSVVAARNDFDEESIVTAVVDALGNELTARYESVLTKESILSIIGSVFDGQIPIEDEIVKTQLMAKIDSHIENELKEKLDSPLTKESMLEILSEVLDNKLGLENSTKAKPALMEAVKSAVERQQFALLGESMNGESFLTMIQEAIDPKLLQQISESLTKESLVSAIISDMEAQRAAESEWAFTEDNVFDLIKSAVEKEASALGVTLSNGSLPMAVISRLKKGLYAAKECSMTEHQLLDCLASAINSEICVELNEGNLTKADLLKAVKMAVAEEKKTMQTSERLLAATFAALEKITLEAGEMIPDKKFLQVTVENVKKEALVKSENEKKKQCLLEKFQKAIEKKISDTCRSVLNEDVAMAALNAVMSSEMAKFVEKEKIAKAISTAFREEKVQSSSGNSDSGHIMKKEKLMALLEEVISDENFFVVPAAKIMKVLNTTIEEKRKEKYGPTLSSQDLVAAVNMAAEEICSQGKGMKMDKNCLLAAVEGCVKKIKSAAEEKVTDGRLIAAVRSVVCDELHAMGEELTVLDSFSKALDLAMEEHTIVRPYLLSEEEMLTLMESTIETELSRNPECAIAKDSLMASVAAGIASKKAKWRESILSERVLLDCMQKVIEEKMTGVNEKSGVCVSLMHSVKAAMEEERMSEQLILLTEDVAVKVASSVMQSALMRGKVVTVTECEIKDVVSDAVQEIRQWKLRSGESRLTKDMLVEKLISTAEGRITDVEEIELLAEAFSLAVKSELAGKAGLNPIPEKKFMEIVASAIETELSALGNPSITKDDLMLSISAAVEEEVKSRGEVLAEEALLATAYSAIEKEFEKNGESTQFKEVLLSSIDSRIECEREYKRVITEDIIFDAINAIADELPDNSKGKSEMIRTITLAVETEKLNTGQCILTGKALLEVLSNAIEDHFSVNYDSTFSKEMLLSALDSAIVKEQSANRGSLLTKELVTMAVASAVDGQVSENPEILDMRNSMLKVTESAVESEFSSPTQRHLSEKVLLSAIGSSVEAVLGELSGTEYLENIVNSMQKYLSENLEEVIVGSVNYMAANESAMDKLKYAVRNSEDTMHVVEKLSSVLNDNMGEAFQKLSAQDPSLLKNVIKMLDVDRLSSTEGAAEALQKAIVGAVRQRSSETLRAMMENSSAYGKDFKELLLQSVGLAKALGMKHVASVLLDVASDPTSHEVLANDDTIIDVLQRLTIMRQFAETKPELASALSQLISDPELARRDPGIRELVRHSTALMTVPEEVLQSSADIPVSLLMSDNSLAMEQFLARARRPRTLLILKAGIQAVVPKESARAVLTGQVPYAVLDEKGITYFEPLHVFSTLKLQYYASKCFSMYRCPEMDFDSDSLMSSTPRGSFSSAEDCLSKDRRFSASNGYWEPRRHYPANRRCSDFSRRPVCDSFALTKNPYVNGFTFRDGYNLQDHRMRERNGLYFTQGCL